GHRLDELDEVEEPEELGQRPLEEGPRVEAAVAEPAGARAVLTDGAEVAGQGAHHEVRGEEAAGPVAAGGEVDEDGRAEELEEQPAGVARPETWVLDVVGGRGEVGRGEGEVRPRCLPADVA